MVKTIHIHLGPHKTGSTAIQAVLSDRNETIAKNLGIHVISGPLTSQISRSLRDEDDSTTASHMNELRAQCDKVTGNCMISCEDFAGDLPGRTRKRRPYPRLWQNINSFIRAFHPHHCVFYFFVREPAAWLKSAYVQSIKHRTRFTSFDQYVEFVNTGELWDGVLAKTIEKIGKQLVCIPYKEDKTFSSIEALIREVSKSRDVSHLGLVAPRVNSSPSSEVIGILERINRSSASNRSKRNAKLSIFSSEPAKHTEMEKTRFPDWDRQPPKPEWLAEDLEKLWTRVEQRVHKQEQCNLLPAPNSDLTSLRRKVVASPSEFPSGGRSDMKNQVKILEYRFRGLPETCLLLGLTISYLRRHTEHTEHAALLFQRLWEEEYNILLGTLPTRWLISVFQTFLDHGANEHQRVVGGSAYFFSNILKAYEGERAIEGLSPDAMYPNAQPVTKTGFAGMDRFNLGGTDLLLNTNALLLEIASREQRVGRVVQEFLSRLKTANSVFSRMDQNRIAHDIDNPQFDNCWSFFEDPR